MQLADDPLVVVKQRRTRRAGLGRPEVPVGDAHVRAGAAGDAAAVVGVRGRLVLEGDLLGVAARVVDGYRGRRRGRAAVPAGVGDAPGSVRCAVQLDQGEVRGAPARAVGRADGELVQRRVVAVAVRVLVVPVADQRRGLTRADAAVVGGQKEVAAVLRGVVDHRAGAEDRAAGRVGGDRGDLVFPAVALRAVDVNVARAAAVVVGHQGRRSGAEEAVAAADVLEVELQLRDARRRQVDLADQLWAEDDRGPKVTGRLVVAAVERADDAVAVWAVELHATAARHREGPKAQVDVVGAGALDAKSPKRPLAVERFPGAVGAGRDRDPVRDREARRLAVAGALHVLCRQRLPVERRHLDARDERRRAGVRVDEAHGLGALSDQRGGDRQCAG